MDRYASHQDSNQSRESPKTPTVSVILPTYNRAQSLGRAISSVLNQTYHDFELIIVDDGSNDNTSEVVLSINDPRIIYIKHLSNQGAGKARNSGIKASHGMLIAFQDSDDEWLPESLEKRANRFANSYANDHRIGVVFSQFIRKKGFQYSTFPQIETASCYIDWSKKLLEENYISTQTVLIKRECFDDVGVFDESLPCLLDWDLCIRLAVNYKFAFIAEPLVVVHRSSDSISTSPLYLAKSYERIITKYHSLFDSEGMLLGKHYYRAGNSLILAGQLKPGRKYILKAIQYEPSRSRYWIAYVISLCGYKFYQYIFKLKSAIFDEW